MTQAGLDQRHVLQSGLHAGESIEKKRRKIGGGHKDGWRLTSLLFLMVLGIASH